METYQQKLEKILSEYSNEKNKEILAALVMARKILEIAINGTPSGELRNKLCDANIALCETLIANNSF